MPEISRERGLDQLVVLMFENRSFDQLLGYLYRPGEVPRFDGVAGGNFRNPIPAGADGAERGFVAAHPAPNLDTPDPDPGEEYPHVNTQLFGTVDPASNRDAAVGAMRAPFNAPADPTAVPTMDGFVADYIGEYTVEMGRPPTYAVYSEIMGCYTPEQLPVLSTLAREFAVFDRWFCEVPSQTYCNRSFLHAASSSGLVLNDPPGSFARKNTAVTIFERLHDAGRSWKVYIDPLQLVPATALIHAANLSRWFGDHFATIFDFYDEARNGTLPDYAFLEPNMLHPHTDMHPPDFGRLRATLDLRGGDAVDGGERLLADVYGAVRSAASPDGSNWSNTLLLVTFDEHGGTYDHVPPPAVSPPNPPTGNEQMGFRFDRSGVRVPAIAISPWIDRRTVVSDEYRHTSVVRTLIERWSLEGPLTARDAAAPSLAPLLRRSAPRLPADWPTVTARAPSWLERGEELLERSLGGLEASLVGEALAHEAQRLGGSPAADARGLKLREARHHLGRIQGRFFPGVAGGRSR